MQLAILKCAIGEIETILCFKMFRLSGIVLTDTDFRAVAHTRAPCFVLQWLVSRL
jgi:hypothetical protein